MNPKKSDLFWMCNFQTHFSDLISHVFVMKLPFRGMPEAILDDKSTLVQVMTWCSQATTHYLSQSWPKSILPHGIIKPQCIKHPESEWMKRYNIIFMCRYKCRLANVWKLLGVVLFAATRGKAQRHDICMALRSFCAMWKVFTKKRVFLCFTSNIRRNSGVISCWMMSSIDSKLKSHIFQVQIMDPKKSPFKCCQIFYHPEFM